MSAARVAHAGFLWPLCAWLLSACGADLTTPAVSHPRPAASAGPCHDFQLDVEEVWNAERKAAVHAAFIELGVDYAEHAVYRVTTGMDAVASDWVRLCQRLCTDHYVRGIIDAREYAARSACFDAALIRQRTLVLWLATPGDGYAAHALEAFEQLSEKLQACELRALSALDEAGGPTDTRTLVRLEAEAALAAELRDPARVERAAAGLLAHAQTAGDGRARVEAWLARAEAALVRGDYADSERCLREASESLERDAVNRPLLAARVAFVEGQLHMHQGDAGFALSAFGRALSLRSSLLGPDDAAIARALDSLGAAHTALGQFDRALTLHQQALAIYARDPALHPVALSDAENNLGMALRGLGQPEAAIDTYARVLGREPPSPHDDRVRVADTLYNLSLAEYDLGRGATARPRLSQALSIYERALGPNHPRLLRVLQALGVLDMEAGRLPQAQAMFERALQLATAGDPGPRTLSDIELDLGRVYALQQAFAAARAHFQRALDLQLESGQTDRRVLGDCRANLARAELSMGRPREALTGWEGALADYRSLNPPPVDRLLSALQALSELHAQRSDCGRFRRAAGEAAFVAQRSLGADRARALAQALAQVGRRHGCPPTLEP